MSFFNRTIVTKKLRNIIDTFFRKILKNKQRLYPPEYFYCTTNIEKKCKKVFQSHSKMFFPVQNNFPMESEKNMVLLLLKSRFE